MAGSGKQKKRTTMARDRKIRTPLPYLNNWKLIALTIGINVLYALLFWHKDFGLKDLLLDTVCCAAITAFFDVFAVAHFIGGKRLAETLFREDPYRRLIGLLPRGRFGLSAALTLIAAVGMAGINGGLFRFYALQSLSMPQFLVWKAIYALALSSWIVELAVYRLILPDDGPAGIPETVSEEEVRHPIPRIAWAAAFLKGMIFDFGFNVACGLFFGGTVIRGAEVILMPVPCRGIEMLITTALTGIIIAFFVIPSAVSGIAAALRAGNVPPLNRRSRFLSVLPRNRWLLTLFLLPFFVLMTVLVCGGVFMLFDFGTLNFFQFYLIRAIYVSLLCKAVLPLIVLRFRQPYGMEDTQQS